MVLSKLSREDQACRSSSARVIQSNYLERDVQHEGLDDLGMCFIYGQLTK